MNRTHGWGLVGRPQGLRFSPRYLSVADGGSTRAVPKLMRRRPGEKDRKCFECWSVHPAETAALKRDTWTFVAGAEDQGFFFYMLFLWHELGVYVNTAEAVGVGKWTTRLELTCFYDDATKKMF